MSEYTDNIGCELARCRWENRKLKEQLRTFADALENVIRASCYYELREEDDVIADAQEILRAYYGER